MRRLVIVLGLSSTLLLAGPAVAGTALLKATALLQDRSEHSVRTAILEAIEVGVRRAVAMGLPWVHIRPPLLMEDRVIVEIVATDAAPEDEGQPGPQPGGQSGVGEVPGRDPSGNVYSF